ncbi:MAG: hypothetical protein ACXWTY_00600 [Methylobacter sp.]|jgi:hypothetical protein
MMEVVNSFEINAMAGGKKNYAANRLRTDPAFPQPIIEQNGFPSVWIKKEIEAYLAKQAAKPKKHAKQNIVPRAKLDLTLAQHFIRRPKSII